MVEVAAPPKMLKPSEVAKLLDCSARKVQALAQEGVIPSVRMGHEWRFPAEKIWQYARGEWQDKQLEGVKAAVRKGNRW